MLISGTALVWCDDQEMELFEGGIVYLPRGIPHSYRITSPTADLLMIRTRRDRRDVPSRRAGPGDTATRRVRDPDFAAR